MPSIETKIPNSQHEPFAFDDLFETARTAGIDPELARKMSFMGTLTIARNSFTLQIPNKITKNTAEFKFELTQVEIAVIKEGQRKVYVTVDDVTLKNVKLTPQGDLIVKKPEWHPFENFGICEDGSILLNLRE